MEKQRMLDAEARMERMKKETEIQMKQHDEMLKTKAEMVAKTQRMNEIMRYRTIQKDISKILKLKIFS